MKAGRAPLAALAAAIILLLALAAGAQAQSGLSTTKPNIVFVLTDDLSWDLVDYMPNVQQLRSEGVTFSNYIVTDSLCCPSRASILTGKYPHNTGIYKNTGADGGFLAFRSRGQEQATFATALAAQGYRTALMGKYMNQYNPISVKDAAGRPYIPPGWTDWQGVGNGYPGYGYRMVRDDRVVRRGWRRRDYLTTVLRRDAVGFVRSAVGNGQPFMLELASFAPHTPATPAPRDEGRFASVTAPRSAAFDEVDLSDKPSWLRNHGRLSPGQQARIDELFQRRVRSVQAVDRALGKIRRELRALGVEQNTYVVFSSDNGFHMGQHRLTPGKLTAYDPDIRVPLVVAGPGVPAGSTIDAVAENVDLCPTFSELGGAVVPAAVDGRSLVPFLRGQPAPLDWREAALVEHRGAVTSPADPDFPLRGSGNPPTYEALRTRDLLYVEYANGERELYDRRVDPDELQNIAGEASPERLAALSQQVSAMRTCVGVGCRVAARMGRELPLR
ncbi:sulfatase [Conexibacter sp. JD483]|uniref:sulfatase family protein n=1 Tax=unclassified Conexibacter TaxID=2627773 RepID=UPI002715ED4E|nr:MULTISPECIES: sulfatase [unclassified Conexibacter]MDO8186387.1 sulfatase [Conexibacter sp. CPCC 205706]MDO8199786.1 sulfatase [Conexibacter sp. CPCC 205762]MDR9369194.1 sulfatase [Conexibacter sp. JD483]